MSYLITIQTARYSVESGFQYKTDETYPCNGRGLALAVRRVSTLSKVEGQFSAHNDLAIKFVVKGAEQSTGVFLADDKMFRLMWLAEEHASSLFEECKEYIDVNWPKDERAAA